MQADIFNVTVYKLKNEQGPSIGACMIAGVGANIYADFEEAVQACVQVDGKFEPNPVNAEIYNQLYKVYQQIYPQTKTLNEQLKTFR